MHLSLFNSYPVEHGLQGGRDWAHDGFDKQTDDFVVASPQYDLENHQALAVTAIGKDHVVGVLGLTRSMKPIRMSLSRSAYTLSCQ